LTLFEKYADFYDILYRDKDYAGETDYIHRLIKAHRPGSKTILDLGCGTGRHAFLMSKKGYDVTGVDRSEGMLSKARSLQPCSDKHHLLRFTQGDIRVVRIQKSYDVVLSLFHVISYLPKNADVEAAFRTAALHLNHGGLFVFDCWYGPGVLTDPPRQRVKEVETDALFIRRTAVPVMLPQNNVVDVSYLLTVRNKTNRDQLEIRETHRMRYFFGPEVDMFFQLAGFKRIAALEFLKETGPEIQTWNACFIGRKKRS
jgi:SAM-dependent methyltransferase